MPNPGHFTKVPRHYKFAYKIQTVYTEPFKPFVSDSTALVRYFWMYDIRREIISYLFTLTKIDSNTWSPVLLIPYVESFSIPKLH